MKTSEQTRITVRNVKHAAFASEETMCFEATVLFDGEPVCVASNDGKGGADRHQPIRGDNYAAMEGKLTPVRAFIRTLDDEPIDAGHTLKPNLELVVADAVNRYLTERDVQRALKKKLLFTRSDKAGLFQVDLHGVDVAESMDKMRVRQPTITYTFLNELPISDAVRVYIGAARRA